MGEHRSITMRAAVYLGLFLCASVLVAESTAISFDDLVARAEEANHPKPKPEPEQPDLEMEEWSTDHLLGLDVPPPSDMFDSLINQPAHEEPKAPERHVAKKVVHKVHKSHHVAKKVARVAKVAKHIKKVHKVHERREEEQEDNSESDYAESLLGSLTHHKSHKAHTTHKAHKAHKKVKKAPKKEEPHMLSAHLEVLHEHKEHKKRHEESILDGLHAETHADDEVPEED